MEALIQQQPDQIMAVEAISLYRQPWQCIAAPLNGGATKIE